MIFKGFLCIVLAVVYLTWTAYGINEFIKAKSIDKIFPIVGIIFFGLSMVLFIVIAIFYFKQSVLGAI